MTTRILVGDVRDRLAELPDASVHCVVTSPPYYNLRDYGVPGQIGLEPTLSDYLDTMVDVFREVRRVLRDDGTLWLNIGSSYSSSGGIHKSGSYDGALGRKMSGVRRSGVGPHFRNAVQRLVKGRPLVVGNAAAIRVTGKRRDVPLHHNGLPNGVLLRLLGIERVTIKQRQNDFCQVLHTLNVPGDCRLDVPVAFVRRDAADLEIVLDAVDDISIVISQLDSDSQAELGVLRATGVRPGKDDDRPLAIEQPAEPITKLITDGETIGDPFPIDTPLERFPDIYLVDQPIALGDRLDPTSGNLGYFRVAAAGEEHVALSLGDRRIQLCTPVRHTYSFNAFGSLVSMREVYDKATREANALQPKQDLAVPFRLVIALQEDGWILRSTIIWAKPNPMPESVTDRPTSAHEHIFLLTKSRRYHYDADAVRLPAASSTVARLSQNLDAQQGSIRANGGAKTNGAMKAVARLDKQRGHGRRHDGFNDRWDAMTKEEQQETGANLRNVWTIATRPFREAHFATFPPDIPRLCILAGCPEGGTVLDPFLGSGTTLMVADQLGRHGIGIELNPEYARMAERRITGDAPMFADVEVA